MSDQMSGPAGEPAGEPVGEPLGQPLSEDGPPVPTDETTAPWWDATRERRLTVQRCLDCGHRQHYPRALCTGCGGTALALAGASGIGTVDAFTVVHRAPRPGRAVPYVVARVRLAEGPILLTELVGADPESWRCDEPVRLDWRPLPDGNNLPVFTRPDGGPARPGERTKKTNGGL